MLCDLHQLTIELATFLGEWERSNMSDGRKWGGKRRRAAVHILGLLGVGTLIMLTLNLCLSKREPYLRH